MITKLDNWYALSAGHIYYEKIVIALCLVSIVSGMVWILCYLQDLILEQDYDDQFQCLRLRLAQH